MVNTKILCLSTLRIAGRARVRRALEGLVNRGALTLAEACEVWAAAFGGKVIAVNARTGEEV